MLQVNKVSKRYDNARGVQEIDFSMSRGEIVGFLGPNGAGKTTTMRMITGYLYPTSGNILIDGVPLDKHPRAARRKIGYLPEAPPLYPELTVYSYLKFVAELRDIPYREQKLRVEEMMERLGLQGREKQIIKGLSKGYKQRLGLAQAIIHNPDLLILDEPTSGLDPKQIVEIRDLIRGIGQERTVLLSTHILQEVNSICSRVLIINDGKLVMDGKTDDLTHKSGRDGFEVSMTVKGPQADVLRTVNGTEGVSAVQATARQAGDDPTWTRVTISARYDVREAVFFSLAQAGFPILEMARASVSLEDVFMKLTADRAPSQEVGEDE